MSTPLQPASDEKALGKPLEGWRLRLYTIIFEADTRAGQLFDRWLIAVILLSLAVVVAGSVNALQVRFETPFTVMEWLFTVIFHDCCRTSLAAAPSSHARSTSPSGSARFALPQTAVPPPPVPPPPLVRATAPTTVSPAARVAT